MNLHTQRTLTSLSLAFSSLILLIFALPPFQFPTIFFAFVPLFFLSKTNSKKEIVIWAGIAGFFYYMAVVWPLSSLTSWWWNDISSSLWIYRYLIIYGSLILTAILSSVWTFILFFYLFHGLDKNNLLVYVVMPTVWVGLECVRIIFAANFGWGTFGYLVYFENLIALSQFISVFGLTFLVILINLLIVNAIYYRQYKNLVIILFISIICFSFPSLNRSKTEDGGKKEITIATIAPNIPTSETTTKNGGTKYFSLITKSLEHNPDFIILPENAFPFLTINEETLLPYKPTKTTEQFFNDFAEISSQASSTSFILGVRTEKQDQRFNSVVVFEKGKIVDVYHKRILLPFAEKSPEWLEKSHIDPLFTEPGQSFVNTMFGKVDIRICSEIYFPKPRADDSSLFIAHVSNDSIFANPTAHDWAALFSLFRSVENNKNIVRSVKGDLSEIVVPSGKTGNFQKVEDGLSIGKIFVR